LHDRVILRLSVLLEMQGAPGAQAFVVRRFEPGILHPPGPESALAASQHPIDAGEVELIRRPDDGLDRGERRELADLILEPWDDVQPRRHPIVLGREKFFGSPRPRMFYKGDAGVL
jgi:hypothetical protein